jgi:hypothetical protein
MTAFGITGDARTFGTNPTIAGYEVVANDTGRPVAERDTLKAANGVAFVLNGAAAQGQKALIGALSGIRSGR